MRKQTPFKNLPTLSAFYRTEKSRVRYRKLPHANTMENDMGNRHPATIYYWIREDWTGGLKSKHSWSGDPGDVWVD